MNETITDNQFPPFHTRFFRSTLSHEEREVIFQAAFRAPTAGNMMLYSIIEVEDQSLKEKLVETCDNQPFIAKSPFVLVFLADYQRWWDYYQVMWCLEKALELNRLLRKPQVGDLMLACCDALIAAQNAVIAAESLGIHSCYIGDIMENYEIHRDLFNLPQYTFPIAMLCFGFPKHEKIHPELTPRFQPEFIAFKNHYQRLDHEEFRQMYAHSGRKVSKN